jgi:hypothetical protein
MTNMHRCSRLSTELKSITPLQARVWVTPLQARVWVTPLQARVWVTPLQAMVWVTPLQVRVWVTLLQVRVRVTPLQARVWVITEDPTVTVYVKCRTVIQALFIYITLCLSVMFNNLSCSFTSISNFTNTFVHLTFQKYPC